MYDRSRAEFHQGSQQQHQSIDSLEEDAAGAGTIQRALVPRYDTAAMYIGILEKHRLFTPLHSKRTAKAPSRFFWLAPKPGTCSLTMGVVSRKSVQLLQQQHGRRYRAQGGISSGTQVGLVRQLYQCHEVSAGVYETPL